ncbi:MAG: hypothetical protein LBS31_03065 [Candidatus Adiutrix sp.]|jgi:hypothetical protein|nr:hypothetical protein [Candidatus Adiutrix sp.]
MTDNIMNSEVVIPSVMADLEWVWVLASSVARGRDALFVVEMEEEDLERRRRIVPIFEAREAAAGLKEKLCQGKAGKYIEQSMRLSEVGRFAAKNNLEIMLLDEAGRIMAHMEARLEQHSLH